VSSAGHAGVDASLSDQMEGGDVIETIRSDVAGEIASEVELMTNIKE